MGAAQARPADGENSRVTSDGPSAEGEPQAVLCPLTSAAIFLVVLIKPGSQSTETVRGLCGDLAALVRGVGFRDPDGFLTCVAGFGPDAWDRLAGPPRPAGLHPFRPISAGGRHAVSTPGDLLFHIRAAHMDLCFELGAQIMSRLGTAVTAIDEVHGFRYFDERDVIGFVDGTENPVGAAAAKATIIGAEEPAFAGGSYVIVQKYLHDLAGWNALPTEEQEKIIGRTKLSDIELDDSVKPGYAHNALTTIVEDGEEVQILRDNMPFGAVGSGEYGTYFIGYARTPAVTEKMLTNMFVGSPEGNYDRLLDFSRAITGSLFFVPSAPLLASVAEQQGAGPPAGLEAGAGEGEPAASVSDATLATASPDPDARGGSQHGSVNNGSLNIGSLRGASQDE